ncbi:MAG TPA: hypothetical protein PLF40_04125 [Kofleriaceae bacterium]|nr:hypothetical protein [Kofleriaceae bacterium]
MSRKRTKEPDACPIWFAGIFPVPATEPAATADDGFDTGASEALVWLGQHGQQLGVDFLALGTAIDTAADYFWTTTEFPLVGPEHVPERIHVADAAFAARLQEQLGDKVKVVCTPTPELDAFVAHMIQRTQDQARVVAPTSTTYLAQGVDADALAAYFASAARLYNAAPWKQASNTALSISLPAFGLQDAVIWTMNDAHDPFAYTLLNNYYDLIRNSFVFNYQADIGEAKPPAPNQWAQGFVRAGELNPSREAEIASHAWPVASDDALPEIIVARDGHYSHEPTLRDVRLLTAVNNAIAEMMKRFPNDGLHFSAPRTKLKYALSVSDGESTSVAIIVLPHPFDAAQPSRVQLVEAFAAAAEGAALGPRIRWVDAFLRCYQSLYNRPIAYLTDHELYTTLTRAFANDVACRTSDAEAIITAVAALLRYLQRCEQLPNAADCLAMLDDDAVAGLRAAIDEAGDERADDVADAYGDHDDAEGDAADTDAWHTAIAAEGLTAWLTRVDPTGGLSDPDDSRNPATFMRANSPDTRGAKPASTSHGARNDKRSAKEKNKRKAAKAARKKNR